MSFIKESPIGYNEALVLKFALTKVVPHFEKVAEEAKEDRKVRATENLDSAKDMLKDLEKMFEK